MVRGCRWGEGGREGNGVRRGRKGREKRGREKGEKRGGEREKGGGEEGEGRKRPPVHPLILAVNYGIKMV